MLGGPKGSQKEIILPQVKTELKEEFMDTSFLRHNNMYFNKEVHHGKQT